MERKKLFTDLIIKDWPRALCPKVYTARPNRMSLIFSYISLAVPSSCRLSLDFFDRTTGTILIMDLERLTISSATINCSPLKE